MASLSTDKKTGTRRIQFLDDGARRTIRLGKMPKKSAESVKARVEHLIVARTAGVAIDAETARWVADLGDDLHDKIARVGLSPPGRPAWSSPWRPCSTPSTRTRRTT
jgi:hypothetical protein